MWIGQLSIASLFIDLPDQEQKVTKHGINRHLQRYFAFSLRSLLGTFRNQLWVFIGTVFPQVSVRYKEADARSDRELQ